MEKDKIRQFEIIFIELNRYLAYGEKNSAIAFDTVNCISCTLNTILTFPSFISKL